MPARDQPNSSPPERRLRHRLEAFALRGAITLFRPLSVDRASWIMGKLWRHVLPFGRRNARALVNLGYVMPHLSEPERIRIAAEMRENFGRVFIEAFRIEEIARLKRFDLARADALARLAATSDGMVIASLHQGNWEACTSAAMALGVRPAGVYRELTNPIVEADLAAVRAPFYPLGLFCKRPGSDIARKLLSLVKSGGAIAILADLRENSGIALDFLGKPSSANPFPAFLARMTGKPLIAARLIRVNGVQFRAEVESIEIPVTDDRQADITEATRRLSAVFERWVRDTPEQWLWTHRKWDLPDDRGRSGV